jgi:DNA-binding IclR family transcriptional regulator
MQLLEILAASPKPRGVKDLADEAGMTQSNVHRLLQTLVGLNYVRQEGKRGLYTATPRMYAIGRIVIDRIEIVAVATPFLQRLNELSHEYCSLSIWHDNAPLLIKSVETSVRHPLRLFTQSSLRTAATCTSAGLILLAYQPESVIEGFAASLHRATSRSISTPEELRARLEEIRRTGRIIVRDEWQFGLSAVSVPVYLDGDVIAVLTISAPSDRLTQDVAEALVDPLHSAANDISALMRGTVRQ